MAHDVDDRLIHKLQQLCDRSEELNEQLTDTATVTDPTKLIAITKELGRLRRLVEPFKVFRTVRSELCDAREIVADRSQAAEMRQLAESEIESLQTRNDQMLDSLKATVRALVRLPEVLAVRRRRSGRKTVPDEALTAPQAQ